VTIPVQPSDRQLLRGLTLPHAVALVIGTVIGTGVFLKAAIMAQEVRSPGLVLAAWIVAGLLSLAGALTYAELGALLPHAGGEYNYLRVAYGDAPAFLFGWMRFIVASTGSIASLAAGFATFLAALVPLNQVWTEHTFRLLGQTITWQFGMRQVVAVVVILLVSAVNCAGVLLGGRLQTILTALKVGSIAFIIGGVFLFSKGLHTAGLFTGAGGSWSRMSAFGAAMLAALWAYEGWNQMPMASAEIKHPERNIPRALVIGMITVVLLYCLANAAYLWVLPFGEVLSSNSTLHRDALPVAAKAAHTFLGPLGIEVISVIFLISTIGALNGTTLLCARVPYAMARDGLFFSRLAQISEHTRVPVFSIAVQAVWACVLALSGTYDQLTDYVVFGSWIFFALVASLVFVLRKKMADAPRPYRTPGYPVMPALFLVVACWLVLNTMRTRPVESAAGLTLIASGIPIYLYFRYTKHKAAMRAASS
jgi:APA family basic amino acid/polyamine antiporter